MEAWSQKQRELRRKLSGTNVLVEDLASVPPCMEVRPETVTKRRRNVVMPHENLELVPLAVELCTGRVEALNDWGRQEAVVVKLPPNLTQTTRAVLFAAVPITDA